MAEDPSPDFVEALARGLAIITAFSPTATALSVSDAAARTSLPRPTARRLLMTLERLGYVRSSNGLYTLTTKVLELGTVGHGDLDVAKLADGKLWIAYAAQGKKTDAARTFDKLYVSELPALP